MYIFFSKSTFFNHLARVVSCDVICVVVGFPKNFLASPMCNLDFIDYIYDRKTT